MQDNRKDLIRARAYRLWEDGGKQDGMAEHYWLVAEQQIEAELTTTIRPAGPGAMEFPPDDWDRIDEKSDESFPASDPLGNY